MTVHQGTMAILIEGPVHGKPALPMPRWAGFSAILCWLSQRTESGACDTSENLSSDTVDAEDWADVRASLNGNGEAYARLVRRYQRPISLYLWRFTRDHNELEELVQQVFVEAYQSLAKFAGKAPLLHWLKRIATRTGYRLWKDRTRRQRECAWPEDADSIAAAVDDLEKARHAAEVVHLLLAELKPRDRLVLTLAYLEDCTVKEIARLTGWTETMVKVQSHRARRRFATVCEQRGIEL